MKNFKLKTLALAIMVSVSVSAQAAPTCDTTITGDTAGGCTAVGGDELVIGPNGSLTTLALDNISVVDVSQAMTSIVNDGHIDHIGSGYNSVRVNSGGSIGSISNELTGVMDGGIYVTSGGSVPIINNEGSILSNSGGGIDIADGSTVIFNSGTIAGDFGGIRAFNTGVITSLTNTGEISGPDAISAAGGGTINLINNSGIINGNVIMGAATLNLTGIEAVINGDVTGSLGSVVNLAGMYTTGGAFNTVETFNVDTGSRLYVVHAMDVDTFNNNGLLRIEPTYTAVITGDYNQGSTGILNVTASDDTTYSVMQVNGTATLPSNAKIAVDVTSPNFVFTSALVNGMSGVLQAGILVSDGTFSVTDNSALFDFDAVKNFNSVDLTLTASTVNNALNAIKESRYTAAIGAATTFDGLVSEFASTGTTGDADMDIVVGQLGAFSSNSALADAIESTLPAASGAVGQATMGAAGSVTTLVSARQDSNRGMASGDEFLTDKHMWLKPFGSWAEQDTRQGVSGYDVDSYGLAIGMDGELNTNLTAGFAFAYIDSEVNSVLAAGGSNVNVDTFLGKVYASQVFANDLVLNTQAGLGWSQYDSQRRLFNNDVASADYDSVSVQLSAELERSYEVNVNTVLTPYVGADYSYVSVDGYKEKGAAALNLNADSSNYDSLVLSVGVKGEFDATDTLVLLGNVGLGYDLMTDASTLTSSYAGGGAQFTTTGVAPDELTYTAGFGAKYALANGTELIAHYDFTGRQDFTDQSASITARWMF